MNLINRFKALVNRLLPRASFARSVGVLAGGTAAAQAIGILVLPVVTRLYTPADFSVLAVYSAILGIAAGVACLRLDIAIPLPERDEDAANLLAVAMLSCTAAALLAAVMVWWFPDQIVGAVGQPGLRPFLWMIPLGIWLASAYSAVQFWATRKKRFTAIAKTRIRQTAGSTSAQLAGGVWGSFGALGLLLGQLIGSGAGVIGLGRTAWRDDREALRGIAWTEMRRIFRNYDRFPKYSTFEALANNGAIQLPVIIIAAVALGPEAGYLFLAMRAMAIPIGLVGGAVSQVYLSRAPEEMRAGQLASFTLQAIAGLVRTGIGPLLFAGMVSPVAFPLIFGADWQRAGEMVAWITPWMIIQFLVSPISLALHIANRQGTALVLQLIGLLIRIGAVLMAVYVSKKNIVEAYSISGLVFYLIYLFAVLHVVRVDFSEIVKIFLKNAWMLFAWVTIGIIFNRVLAAYST